jgi:CPA2 family monovalent cation:H+ antiporter-2
LFVVLFFVSMGTLINIGALLTVTLPIVAVLAVAIFGKFLGCWTGARLSGAKDDATIVGLSMLPRGEFSFIVAQEGTGLGVAAQILYPVAGLVTLISSILSSVGLRVFKPSTTPDASKVKISRRLRQLGRSRNTKREKS